LVIVLLVVAEAGRAHFNMLLPHAASIKRGDPITLTYQWGHPFEHQLFPARAPLGLAAYSPDGKRVDQMAALEKVAGTTNDTTTPVTYRFRFTPEARGDYLFVLNTPPIWMEEDKEFLQDTVKVIVHVQAQRGWDQSAGQPFEMMPLTRPYGLEPGMVFQAQVLHKGKPVSGSLVEVERYNPAPPKELPPDEQMTRTAKTDPNGVLTCTLTDPGWWCLTASRDGGKHERAGATYPLRQRTTLWVHVDDKRLK
jgi:cobalt/nickel transport protein